MKRILSAILCLIIALSCLSSLAESELNTFISPLVTGFNKDAREWMLGEKNRGYFTVCIMMDQYLMRKEGEEYPFEIDILESNSYVGRSDSLVVLTVLSKDEKQMMVFLYDTQAEEASWFTATCAGRFAAEAAMEKTCSDGYYKNDPSVLSTVYLEIWEVLQDME